MAGPHNFKGLKFSFKVVVRIRFRLALGCVTCGMCALSEGARVTLGEGPLRK